MPNVKCLCVAVAMFSLSLFASAEEKSSLKITEISLTRSGGKAGSPQDTLTLRADGSAAYVGVKDVGRLGDYQGTIPDWYFHDSFPRLAEMYAAIHDTGVSTGKPTESVTVVKLRVVVDGKPKEITDLCPGIDERLWALEMSARGVAADIAWERRPAK